MYHLRHEVSVLGNLNRRGNNSRGSQKEDDDAGSDLNHSQGWRKLKVL